MTEPFNGQKHRVHFGLEGNSDDLKKAFGTKEKGKATIVVKDLSLMYLPHKPAYHMATFVSVVEFH
jgi:hypothetical protein